MLRESSFNPAWPIVPLSDAVTFLDNLRKPVKASDRVEGPYSYYGANGLQGTINDYIFDEPLVLLAEDGGHFGNPDRDIAYIAEGKYWVNNHAHVLKPNENVDLRFLYRVLQRYDVTPFIKGATRAKLTKGDAGRIPFPVPPLKEQQRIAAILDKADAIRRKRQQATTLVDEFLRAVFLDMFGDPVTNPKGWDVVDLGSQLKFLTSGGRGWSKYYSNVGARFLRSLDVRMNKIGNDDIAYVIPPKSAESNRTRVEPGDVLLTITGSRIGRVCTVPHEFGEGYISQHVALLRLVDQIAPRFLSMYLSLDSGGQRQISKSQYGQTKPGLNFEQIRRFRVPVPPFNLQESFVKILDGVERSRLLYSERDLNLLKLEKSLNQRAFSGV